MQITTYREYKYPKSQYACIVAHQQNKPWIGDLNYFQKISRPSIQRYCKQWNIDLIIIDDFKKDQYVCPQDSRIFNNRVNCYPVIVQAQLIKKYKNTLLYASNTILHKTYKHFKDIIPNLKDYDAVSLQTPKPYQNYYIKTGYPEYKNGFNGWFGHGSVVSPNISQHWFDQDQMFKWKMNDLQYRRHYNDTNKDKVKVKVLYGKYLLNIDYWCVQALQFLRKNNMQVSSQTINHWIYNNIDFTQYLIDQNYTNSFFGGCGSGSDIWILRYFLMKTYYNKYKKFLY